MCGSLSATMTYSASLAVVSRGSDKQPMLFSVMVSVRKTCLNTISWKRLWSNGLLVTSLKPSVPDAGLWGQICRRTKHMLVRGARRQSIFQHSVLSSAKNGTETKKLTGRGGSASTVSIQPAQSVTSDHCMRFHIMHWLMANITALIANISRVTFAR